jgi:hypothetical protein
VIPVPRPDGASGVPDPLAELLNCAPSAVAYLSAPGLVIEFANDACRELAGRRDLAGRQAREVFPGLAAQGKLDALMEVLRTGEPVKGSGARVELYRGGRGQELFFDYLCMPARDASGAVTGVLLYASDVTTAVRDRHRAAELEVLLAETGERCRARYERARSRLAGREKTARAEAARIRERLTHLLQAGAEAAAAGDRARLLRHAADLAAHLVVPGLGDFCIVYLPAGDGMLRAAGVTHRDPRLAAVLRRLYRQQIAASGPLISQDAYTHGLIRLVTDVSTELPAWARAEPAVAGIFGRVQAASAVAVPLSAGAQRLGVMVLGRDTHRRPFTTGDLDVIRRFAHGLGAAMAASGTIAQDRTIAETLQRALLPTLPVIPELDLAIRYLPATGADVGGDWYDVFRVGGSQVGLVIGDVAGHSLTSASAMVQIRSMLRAYAIHHPHPRAVLRRISHAVAGLMPSVMVTVACAVLDTSSGDFSYANAGHPPPLLIGADGRAEYLTAASGIVLGAAREPRLLPARRNLAPGGTLFFYTDGLVEDRGRDLGKGMADLAAALRGHPGRDADDICAAAQAALLGDSHRSDDVCLLAVRRLP